MGGPGRGYDAAKRTAGRKRHILVDVAGLVFLAHVHAADLHDRRGAQLLIERAGEGALPRLELVWADGAYAGTFARWLEAERKRGFEAQPATPGAQLASALAQHHGMSSSMRLFGQPLTRRVSRSVK